MWLESTDGSNVRTLHQTLSAEWLQIGARHSYGDVRNGLADGTGELESMARAGADYENLVVSRMWPNEKMSVRRIGIQAGN